jgi:Fur family ferric uptake transcriptional regulator
MNAVQKPKRNTWQREAVRTALSSTEGFVSAQALHQHLRDDGSTIGLATVYRALQAMADAGEVDVLHGAAGETTYRRCSPDHHHHLVCRSCGRTVEIVAPTVEVWARTVAAEHDFAEVSHTVELLGLCSDCRRS